MKVRFRTGEIAKMHGVSKQTVIYYDKIGLFQPQETDPDTGYRYYMLEQCEVLDVILALKHIGMPLKEIKRYLALDMIEDRLVLLETQESEIEKRLAVIERSRRRIHLMIGAFKERMQLVPFEMGVKHVERREMYRVLVNPPYDLYQLELAIKAAYQTIVEDYDSGLHELLAIVDIGPEGEDQFKKIGIYVEGGGNDAVSEGEYAYIIHKGTHENIPSSRQKLLSYLDKLNLKPTGSFVENILMDYMAVSTEDEYIVEVLLRVGD